MLSVFPLPPVPELFGVPGCPTVPDLLSEWLASVPVPVPELPDSVVPPRTWCRVSNHLVHWGWCPYPRRIPVPGLTPGGAPRPRGRVRGRADAAHAAAAGGSHPRGPSTGAGAALATPGGHGPRAADAPAGLLYILLIAPGHHGQTEHAHDEGFPKRSSHGDHVISPGSQTHPPESWHGVTGRPGNGSQTECRRWRRRSDNAPGWGNPGCERAGGRCRRRRMARRPGRWRRFQGWRLRRWRWTNQR